MRIFSTGYDSDAIIPSVVTRASASTRYRSNMGGPLMPRGSVKSRVSGDDVGGFSDGLGQGLGITLSVVGLAAGYSYLKHKKFIKGRLF